MPEQMPESLQQKIEERLRYYEDLGIRLFYRDRRGSPISTGHPEISNQPAVRAAPEIVVSKPVELPNAVVMRPLQRVEPAISPSGPTLFEAVDKVADDTLPKIR